MHRRHAAVAVVAVALLALPGTATVAAATTDSTDSTTPTAAVPPENGTVVVATEGDRVVLRAAADQTVRGRAGLPPGTELSIRLRGSGDAAFLKGRTVTVGDDGTFAASFDLDDVDGYLPISGVVSVRSADGVLRREYDAVVRPSASTTESTTTGSTTTAATSTTVPGFGAGLATAASLLVAALAATRAAR